MATIKAKFNLIKDEYSAAEIEMETTKHFTVTDEGYKKYLDFCAELWVRLTAPLEAPRD